MDDELDRMLTEVCKIEAYAALRDLVEDYVIEKEDQAYRDGEYAGYHEGRADGKDDGYENGYEAGKEDGYANAMDLMHED